MEKGKGTRSQALFNWERWDANVYTRTAETRKKSDSRTIAGMKHRKKKEHHDLFKLEAARPEPNLEKIQYHAPQIRKTP